MKDHTFMTDPQVEKLRSLITAVRKGAKNIAVVILAEDADIIDKWPALKQVRFLERLDSDAELNRIVKIFHKNDIACRVVYGLKEFIKLALEDRLFPSSAGIKVVLDKTEGGGHRDGFGPARRSTGALLCNQFGYHYSHSDAYSAAITRHKHHQALLMQMVDIPVPQTWSYDTRLRWITGKPAFGTKVICKSTYEAWSIGVSEKTTGPFNETLEREIKLLAEEIGQPVCVQEYIDGKEIYSLIIEMDELIVAGLADVESSTGPKPNGSYLAFDDHSTPGGIVYAQIEGLSAETIENIKKATIDTFRLLGMSGHGRIDFRVNSSGRPYIIDIADHPGTSPQSSLAFILKHVGFNPDEIPILLLALSLKRSDAMQSKLAQNIDQN